MNPTPEPPVTVRPASEQLVALAVAVREDWSPRDVRAVLAHAHTVGMTWPQVLTELPRLMVDPDAGPGELVPDSRDPLALRRRRHPDDPNPEYEAARAALEDPQGDTR